MSASSCDAGVLAVMRFWPGLKPYLKESSSARVKSRPDICRPASQAFPQATLRGARAGNAKTGDISAFVILMLFAFMMLSAFPAPAQNAASPSQTIEARRITGKVELGALPAPAGVRVSLQIAFDPQDKSRGAEVAHTETAAGGKFAFEHLETIGQKQGREAFAVSAIYPGYNGAVEVVDLTTAASGQANLVLPRLARARPDAGMKGMAAPAPGVRPSKNPQVQQEMAEAQDRLFKQHDAPGAAESLKKALKLDPWYGPGYLLLGLAYMQMQDWSEAHWAFTEATKVEPGNAQGYLGAGSALNEQRNYAEAQKALEHSLELRPDSAEAHYELARSLAAEGKWEAAQPHVLRALEINPDYAGPHALMGNLYLQGDDPESALGEFREYLRLDPQGSLAASVKQTIAELEKALAEGKEDR